MSSEGPLSVTMSTYVIVCVPKMSKLGRGTPSTRLDVGWHVVLVSLKVEVCGCSFFN